jgi:hypothetical protein
MYQDPADDFVLDVQEPGIDSAEPDGSALDHALTRILAPSHTHNFTGFNGSI